MLEALLDRLRMPRSLHGDPPQSGAHTGVLHCALGARQPTARRRRPTADQVLVRDPDGETRGIVTTPRARRDSGTDLTEKPERETETVEGVRRLLFLERGLEGFAGGGPPRRLERLPTFVEPATAELRVHRGKV